MAEVDVDAVWWTGKYWTHLQSFPIVIVQMTFVFFDQIFNSHFIDIFVVATGGFQRNQYSQEEEGIYLQIWRAIIFYKIMVADSN